jgi:hypothetical protein
MPKKNINEKLKPDQKTEQKPKEHFFLLMGDIEEKYWGTKQECIDFFQTLPCPIMFRMYECVAEYNIWREFGSKLVQIREVNGKCKK